MLEIIEKCREAECSEVESYQMWLEAKCNKVKWSEVNETSEVNESIEVEWGEVKCGIGKGRGRVFMGKVYRSSKWWEVKGWGESVSELMI